MKSEFKDYIRELEAKRSEYFELVEKYDVSQMTNKEIYDLASQSRIIAARMLSFNKEIIKCIATLQFNADYIQRCCANNDMPGPVAIENLLLGKA